MQLRDNTLQFLMTTGSGWGRTLEETTAQFWMPRDVMVFVHYGVSTHKGGSLRVAEAKCIVQGAR